MNKVNSLKEFSLRGTNGYWRRYYGRISLLEFLLGAGFIVITCISGIRLLYMRDCTSINLSDCKRELKDFISDDFYEDYTTMKEYYCLGDCTCDFGSITVTGYTSDGAGISTFRDCAPGLENIKNTQNLDVVENLENRYQCSGFCETDPIYYLIPVTAI